MPSFTLVRVNGKLRGRSQDDQKAYERHQAAVENMGDGEFFTVTVKHPRNGKFLSKFFVMLNYAFEHWEPERSRKRLTYKGVTIAKNFEQFRKDMLILAGFGIPTYEVGPRGAMRVRMDAKSIAFDKMDDDEFAQVYSAVLDVLVKNVFVNHKRDDVNRVVAELEKFG